MPSELVCTLPDSSSATLLSLELSYYILSLYIPLEVACIPTLDPHSCSLRSICQHSCRPVRAAIQLLSQCCCLRRKFGKPHCATCLISANCVGETGYEDVSAANRTHPHIMDRHPPSSYGDEPPAYLDHEASSYLSDAESPTANSRQNGATMRLLPTSSDDYGDLAGSHRAPSPSHYQSEIGGSTL